MQLKPGIAPDFIALIGLAMLGSGLWIVHPPSALVTLGILFILTGVLGARRGV